MTLDAIEIETSDAPDTCVIWLHGLGADGNDFVGIIPQLQLPDELNIRFIFPHAPLRPISMNQGAVMRGWYDVYSIDKNSREDEEGIIKSSAEISALINEQISAGISSDKIILAGFSQGGAVTLHCALHQPHKLAGIIALSTYLPLSKKFKPEDNLTNMGTSIFMAHGKYDPLVPFDFGKQSYEILKKGGYQAQWHEYAMEHEVSTVEIADIRKWLLGCVG